MSTDLAPSTTAPRRLLVRSLNKAFDLLGGKLLNPARLVDALFLLEATEDTGFFSRYFRTTTPWPSYAYRTNAWELVHALHSAEQTGRVEWKEPGETVRPRLVTLLSRNGYPTTDRAFSLDVGPFACVHLIKRPPYSFYVIR